MREQVSAKLFAAAINETLRRILEKLAANPKSAAPYRDASQKNSRARPPAQTAFRQVLHHAAAGKNFGSLRSLASLEN